MKLLVSLILCITLLAAQAQTNAPPPTKPDCVLLAGIVIVCAVVAGVIIWKVHGTVPSQHEPETFVLEKTQDWVTWTPVATNTVTLNGTNAIEFFREQMVDGLDFYRARWVKKQTP